MQILTTTVELEISIISYAEASLRCVTLSSFSCTMLQVRQQTCFSTIWGLHCFWMWNACASACGKEQTYHA